MRNIGEAVSGMRAVSGPKVQRPSTMRSILALENPKVRKVNRARGTRAQKGARTRDLRAIKASMGATQKVAAALYPHQDLKHALYNSVVSLPILPIVTGIHANREALHRAFL